MYLVFNIICKKIYYIINELLIKSGYLIMKKKILIFIITYKAKHRVMDVYQKIPLKN